MKIQLLAVVATLSAAACTKDPTQIIVQVDSNLEAPVDLDRLDTRVLKDDGEISSSHEFQLPAEVGFPFSFGVAHDGESSLDVTLELLPKLGAEILFTRRAVTKFAEEKTLFLAIYLPRACIDQICPNAGETCTQNGCEPELVSELPELEPGKESSIRIDAGVPTFPVDPPDGGPGPDTGVQVGGFIVDPTSNLSTGEDGTTASFTVRLDREPDNYVAIPVSTSNPNEGSVEDTMLVFTPLDWEQPKTVVVRGVDDGLIDGDVEYSVILGPALSGDKKFENTNPPDVEVTNRDDDGAAVDLIGATGLSTTEHGGTASFGVKLTSEPAANVIIRIRSSDPGEGTIDTATVTVSPAQWTEVISITAHGVDDEDVDGPQIYDLILDFSQSLDPDYAAVSEVRVSITNTDDETPGVTVSPTHISTAEDGSSATFTVVLNTQPADGVTVRLNNQNLLEGSLSEDTLEFVAADWDVPREVIVTGLDDQLDDDAVGYEINLSATSGDPDYQNLTISSVEVENFDDDDAELLLSDSTGLVTTESGGTAQVEVRLATQPIAGVRIMFASSNLAEGTVDGGELVFTTADWNTPQLITITGVDDEVQDGPVLYQVDLLPAVSDDPKYFGLDAGELLVINADNDSAGFTVSPAQVEVAENAGRNAVFSVFLNTRPSGPVTIALSSGDTGEVTISESELTFDGNNWAVPQEVSVSGVDDLVDDGNVMVLITLGPAVSADINYFQRDPPDVTALNTDDDERGITVTPTLGLVTTEAGGLATFTVRLSSQPTAPVTIPLLSSDLSEGTVSPEMLNFTEQNWQTPQTVTITGRPDLIDDDDVLYNIITLDADSLDPRYDNLNGPNVSAINIDDDVAGIEVLAAMPLQTMETGGNGTVRISLLSEPTADVVLTFALSDATEGILRDAPTMTFTPQNWSMRQTVRIRGVDDLTLDGDQVHIFQILPASSGDAKYSGMNPTDLVVINGDDGELPVPALASIVQPPTALGRTENPTINVDGRIIAFDSADDGLVAIDLNNAKDIFVFERSTLSTSRISVSSMGTEGNGDSERPSISGDGRYVAFQSVASNLVANDTNMVSDIFVRDRMMNTTTRVSFDVTGAQRTDASRQPSISRDGRYVVYVSGSNLMADVVCIFVYDRNTGMTTSAGTGDLCQRPMISTDGRWVVFSDGIRDGRSTHRYDRMSNTQTIAGDGVIDPRTGVAMSADGRYLVISGENTGGPNLGYEMVYLIDTSVPASLEAISVSQAGVAADGSSDQPSVSDDGSVVVFRSQASNLGGPMSFNALYSRLRTPGTTAQRAPESQGHSIISGNGRFIVFTADTPVTGDSAIYLVSP